ncbi:hypothetical protein Lwal_3235 [Legionella waltersii]|uniref:Uncharacterized protein n=1 Tax=Legionella waltersii TaxID=66969 RepID=A0A0W1A1I5_9GAMM|nr:hypothetical protein Lwal_3235 [Legionella waltersii]SNV10415.1 Uncharacterised protein [Legionella waltersii]
MSISVFKLITQRWEHHASTAGPVFHPPVKNIWDEGDKWGIRIISELETSLHHFAIVGRMGQSTFLHINKNTKNNY